jgi:hypothetical protein
MALARVLGETNRQELWGDRVTTVIGFNATPTSVNCEVNPVPNLRDQFRNRGAPPRAAVGASTCHWDCGERTAPGNRSLGFLRPSLASLAAAESGLPPR